MLMLRDFRLPRARWAVLLTALLGLGGTSVASAQGFVTRPETPTGGQGDATRLRVDGTLPPLLRRPVTVRLTKVSIVEALTEVARQTGLGMAYDSMVRASPASVTLDAAGTPAAEVILEIMRQTGFEALVGSDRESVRIRRVSRSSVPPVQSGTIVGRVTDAKTGGGLAGADVALEGTRWRTVTGEGGQFRIAEVAAGTYALAVRRIGYARRAQQVTVADEGEVTANVALDPVPTQLDEVVTTVTGDQRRVELGHVVGRINADSVVREAPVSSLSELLNGRVSGLRVFQSQGTVGGNVQVQVRGANSVLLNTEPIVIVDGIRYTTGAAKRPDGFPFGYGPDSVETTSPLNDLNPNDIESIEVVKGPSAATLYGTDAANGVIIVTTKRGQPGRTRWGLYGKGTNSDVSTHDYPNLYWGWNTQRPTLSCSLGLVAQGTCTQDSVTALPNPLNDPRLTIFDDAWSWDYGANVSGGRQDLRYYFSGDLTRATGPIRMPTAIAEQLAAQRGVGELPDEQIRPNGLTRVNLRANISAELGTNADLHIVTGYVHGDTRTLSVRDDPYSIGAYGASPSRSYGAQGDPAAAFSQSSTGQTDRFVGSLTGQWRPVSWLTTRATAGLDLTNRTQTSLVRPGDAPSSQFRDGAVADERVRQVAMTGELGATAIARAGRVSFRTSVGAQYVRTLDDGLASHGAELPPGGTSVGEAAVITSRQTYRETVTLGSYVEETVGLNDRLFVTGALRADGASAFGQDYNATVYPKVSASWLVSEEPFLPRIPFLDELRLRYAFGASGQQPQPNWAHPGFAVHTTTEDGAPATAIGLDGLGNPDLRPERVREHEFGFDGALLHGRVQLGLTWYRRRTVDQIVSANLPPGLGAIYTNLGLTTQHGFEAELQARLLDTRAVSWDVMLQYGLHRTKLVDLGGGVEVYRINGGWVEGYPLGARFDEALIGYADANGDGIVAGSEVQLSDAPVYFGESTPPRTQTLTTTVGLFDRRLRLSALLERRGGFTQVAPTSPCSRRLCAAALDPATPLAEQARVASFSRATFASMIESADYTRLREIGAAVDLPVAVTRLLRVRSATVTLAGRNLALWTSFSGPDPESALVDGAVGGFGANMIPQSRSWMLRLDLGW